MSLSDLPSSPVSGRVIRQAGPLLFIDTPDGVVPARVGGALAHLAADADDLPVVGDEVRVLPGIGGGDGRVINVMPRRSLLRRRAAASEAHAQPIAANVDVVLAVAALDDSLNPRRIERAVLLAWDAGAQPIVVLSKVDLADAAARAEGEARARAAAPGADVIAVSAVSGEGLAELRARLTAGVTAVLIGASGAGKSALTNALLGVARQATQGLSADARRGRHTTTHRELITLEGGAFLIDGPGVRELGMLDDVDVTRGFADVEAFARGCRFRDCAHASEPGCAVRAAIDSGALARERWESFLKLSREVAHAQARVDPEAMRARKAAERALTRAAWSAVRDKRR